MIRYGIDFKLKTMYFTSFRKHYEVPTVAEGFTEVVKVNFLPKFKDVKDERLYRMYLVDS